MKKRLKHALLYVCVNILLLYVSVPQEYRTAKQFWRQIELFNISRYIYLSGIYIYLGESMLDI